MPLSFLMDPANHRLAAKPAWIIDRVRNYYGMPYSKHPIWGRHQACCAEIFITCCAIKHQPLAESQTWLATKPNTKKKDGRFRASLLGNRAYQ